MGLTHVWGLLIQPTKAWCSIRDERPSILYFIPGYLMVMTALPAVCGYFGVTTTGWQLPGSSQTVYLTSASAAVMCILAYFATVAAIVAIAVCVHWMSKTFGTSPTFSQCLVFTAYTATPLLMGGLAGLVPSLWLAIIVASAMIGWSACLLYTGTPIFMGIPVEKGLLFSSSVLCVALVVLVATMAATVTLWTLGAGPVYL